MEQIKEDLKQTPLHELAGKLEKYGVSEAFKPGNKKTAMIEEAIGILEKRAATALLEVGVEDKGDLMEDTNQEGDSGEESENVQENPDNTQLLTEESAMAKSETVSKDGIQDPDLDADQVEFVMSQVDIKKNILNCQLNLIGADEVKKKLLYDKILELKAKLK